LVDLELRRSGYGSNSRTPTPPAGPQSLNHARSPPSSG